MNKFASESLCDLLERLFPKEKTLRIDGGNKKIYFEDDNGNQIAIFSPLKFYIDTIVTHIPELNDAENNVKLLISIPLTTPLAKCLAPTKNESSIFETEELLFDAKITPIHTAHLFLDENKEETNDNLSEFRIDGTSSISIKPHTLNDSIDIKDECIKNLEKYLTLWGLGTKEGEQSLEKYLEKTAKANGVKITTE